MERTLAAASELQAKVASLEDDAALSQGTLLRDISNLPGMSGMTAVAQQRRRYQVTCPPLTAQHSSQAAVDSSSLLVLLHGQPGCMKVGSRRSDWLSSQGGSAEHAAMPDTENRPLHGAAGMSAATEVRLMGQSV